MKEVLLKERQRIFNALEISDEKRDNDYLQM